MTRVQPASLEWALLRRTARSLLTAMAALTVMAWVTGTTGFVQFALAAWLLVLGSGGLGSRSPLPQDSGGDQ